jgi:glyoxylase-like metal-dependent hydrolase (beta-lactamase superfamily II)
VPTRGADWTEPVADSVASGVWRIPLPLSADGLRAVNVYAVDSGDGLVLVDSGWASADAERALDRALRSIDRRLQDIRRCLVTHVHYDHYTMAATLRRQIGVEVFLGAAEEPALRALQSPALPELARNLERLTRLGGAELARTIRAGHPEDPADHNTWEDPDDWLYPGHIALDGGRTLEVVHTPGHTTGHLVFHDVGARLMFTGDHVLSTITPSIGYEPVPARNPLAAFLSSLAVLRQRPDAMLLPAHGPVRGSVHERVRELQEHHIRRLDDTLAAVAGGAGTPYAAAHLLPWTRRRLGLLELDVWHAMLAVFETGAHIDVLVAEQRLTITPGSSPTAYQPT